MVNTARDFLIQLKNQQQIHLKLLHNESFKKTSTADLIGNEITNKITKLLKNSKQINSKTVTNIHDKKIRKESICISRRKTRNY